MKRVRVEIDLNSIRPDGTTRVWLDDFDGDVQAGQMVTAFEREDQVAAHAMIERIDTVRGCAFIIVNRASMRDDDGVLDKVNLHGENRARARVENARASARAVVADHTYAVNHAVVARP